ncbi:GTP-binding protein Rho1, partial [Ceratobasidium sp. 395]
MREFHLKQLQLDLIAKHPGERNEGITGGVESSNVNRHDDAWYFEVQTSEVELDQPQLSVKSQPQRSVFSRLASAFAENKTHRKLVIVGDGGCGKTCLVFWVPTVSDNYVADIEIGSEYVELALWDTSGLEDYDRLRPLSYPDAHIVLICFAIDSPDSLDNVAEKWVSEVNHFCPGVPYILVGCKKELRRGAASDVPASRYPRG